MTRCVNDAHTPKHRHLIAIMQLLVDTDRDVRKDARADRTRGQPQCRAAERWRGACRALDYRRLHRVDGRSGGQERQLRGSQA